MVKNKKGLLQKPGRAIQVFFLIRDKQITDVQEQITDVQEQITDVQEQITDVQDQITDVQDQITDVQEQTVTSVYFFNSLLQITNM